MDRAFRGARWTMGLIAAYLVARVVSAHAVEVPAAGAQVIDQLFQKVAPSVVAIRARGRDPMAGGKTRLTETGSGVLISGDGQVLTAAFVVHGMDEISIEFPGGETVSARVVASEPATADLSLLQLDRVPPSSTVSPMADSSMVEVGENVLIVGAPYRLPHSFSVGSIRARWAPGTAYRSMPVAEFFQTDATVDPGNSGGPMFNLRGEVIGIVSHNIAKGDKREGQSFVVTSNTAKRLLLETRPAWSGVAQRSCSATSWRNC